MIDFHAFHTRSVTFLHSLWQDLRIRMQPDYEAISSGDENEYFRPISRWQHLVHRRRRKLIAIGLVFALLFAILVVRSTPIIHPSPFSESYHYW